MQEPVADRTDAGVLVDGSGESAAREVVLPGKVVRVDIEPETVENLRDVLGLQERWMHNVGAGKLWACRRDERSERHRQQVAHSS